MTPRSELVAALRAETDRDQVIMCPPGWGARIGALIVEHAPDPNRWRVEESVHVPPRGVFLMPETPPLFDVTLHSRLTVEQEMAQYRFGLTEGVVAGVAHDAGHAHHLTRSIITGITA